MTYISKKSIITFDTIWEVLNFKVTVVKAGFNRATLLKKRGGKAEENLKSFLYFDFGFHMEAEVNRLFFLSKSPDIDPLLNLFRPKKSLLYKWHFHV